MSYLSGIIELELPGLVMQTYEEKGTGDSKKQRSRDSYIRQTATNCCYCTVQEEWFNRRTIDGYSCTNALTIPPPPLIGWMLLIRRFCREMRSDFALNN